MFIIVNNIQFDYNSLIIPMLFYFYYIHVDLIISSIIFISYKNFFYIEYKYDYSHPAIQIKHLLSTYRAREKKVKL